MASNVSTAPDHTQLREALVASPSLCPLQWNEQRSAVLFGRFSEAAYGEVSFFDQRAIPAAERTGVVPWEMAEPWLVDLPLRCDFLFHVSHCGSTLLSRLLGTCDGCLAVREPGILRGLSSNDTDSRFDATLGLLSRTFRPQQRPLVKATSVVNAVAAQLLRRAGAAHAALVFVPPETFLAAVLDGSLSDITAHAEDRWQRLQQGDASCGALATPRGPGEHAAAAWLCEMRSLEHVAGLFPARTCWVNFNTFLEQPEPVLRGMAGFFGLPLDASAALEGSTMHRYAKQPGVRYDTQSRAALLAAARETHITDIEAGLNWLAAAGWKPPLPGTL
jgi:hypothetical protein